MRSKFFSVLFFLLIAIQAFSQCCDYLLNMHDSYGDGWNGGQLQILVNGNEIGIFSAVGNNSTATFNVCTGDTIEFFYTAADYEEENTYQLFDASYNLLFANGPNPTAGLAYADTADCNTPAAPGHHPCNAIPIAVGDCVDADNTGFGSTGLNPGCTAYSGGDIWYQLVVPPSGNIGIATSGGNLNDTAIGLWSGENCTSLSAIGCDDDGGPEYYSYLFAFDLTPGDTVYVEALGYGGAQGAFQLCINDLGTINLESSELPIVMINTLGQNIVNDTKIDALMDIKFNGVGNLTYVTDPSNVYEGNVGIEIRGATSAGYPQPSYGFETRTALGDNNNVSLLNMPAENDWVLLSNFNDLSLLRNSLAFKLFGDMGHYSVRTSLCEVMIDSAYKGIYTFGEKIKRDNNRVNIAALDLDDNAGDSLTGGYILQQNYWDGSNSFQSNYSPIDHPDFDVHFVYEYPRADIITAPQKEYIASYIDSLETALYGVNFMDSATGYRNYLGVNSFIDYFLVNELARSNDGFKKSVFFHKDKNSNGGKLKAGPVWDFDWGFKDLATCDLFDNTDGSGWAYLINDCPTDNYSTGWYVRLLQDTTFANQLRCTYEDYRTNILDTNYLFAYIDSIHSLVQNAQARHYQRWPILGLSGPAPELEPIATTYNEEIQKIKTWLMTRLAWLDDNIPGLCSPIIDHVQNENATNALKCFPNPSDGHFRLEGNLPVTSRVQLKVYDVAGNVVESKQLNGGRVQVNYTLEKVGVYYYVITSEFGIIQTGKWVVM